ncbi:hypothetical protein JHK87_055650 [Glycine soja]|nr:hypothetical protein JHK87_055650 [Glycine soja]
MAPFATMILALPAMLLEGKGILEWLNTHPYPWSALVIIFSFGVLAFCLNFSIFYVIHCTTTVTFSVCRKSEEALHNRVDHIPQLNQDPPHTASVTARNH